MGTMRASILTITLCSALVAMAGCKKKSPAATGSGSEAAGGSASTTAPGSGSAPTAGSAAAAGSGSATAPATPAGKDELTSATWKKDGKEGKLAAPLAFDRQIWSDSNHGNLQIFLIGNCPKAPEPCALLKYDNLQHETLDKVCPGWSMIHIVFHPKKGEQKANMGPLKLTTGKYGGESPGLQLSMLEYTDKNDGNPGTVGGQSYQKEPNVDITQVGDTIAGSFDTKYNDYAYKGSFTAKKCTCDPNEPVCK